jgi:hypothetical protein
MNGPSHLGLTKDAILILQSPLIKAHVRNINWGVTERNTLTLLSCKIPSLILAYKWDAFWPNPLNVDIEVDILPIGIDSERRHCNGIILSKSKSLYDFHIRLGYVTLSSLELTKCSKELDEVTSARRIDRNLLILLDEKIDAEF